jgi:hypothetical protein
MGKRDESNRANRLRGSYALLSTDYVPVLVNFFWYCGGIDRGIDDLDDHQYLRCWKMSNRNIPNDKPLRRLHQTHFPVARPVLEQILLP